MLNIPHKDGITSCVAIYSVGEINENILSPLKTAYSPRYKHRFVNIPIAFDIETSMVEITSDEYFTFMYVWQVSIDGVLIVGRTWQDFIDLKQ